MLSQQVKRIRTSYFTQEIGFREHNFEPEIRSPWKLLKKDSETYVEFGKTNKANKITLTSQSFCGTVCKLNTLRCC